MGHGGRRAAWIAATSIFVMSIIAPKARRASSPPMASASVNTRSVTCQGDAPPILAAAACALFTAIADDRVPVAVSITLIFRGDLERESLVVLEHRAAIETGAGDSGHGELHGQHIGLFAAWIVAGCMVDGSDPAVYKSLGVKGCGVLCILGGTEGKSSS